MKKLITNTLLLSAFIVSMTGCNLGDTSKSSEHNSSNSVNSSNNDTDELSGTITMNGSTSMEKAIKAINGAFTAKYPDVTIELNLTGSGTGIQEAMENKIDIGNSSRKLKDDENNLEQTTIGIDGIALIVNNKNTVDDITLEELEKIYAGKIKNWSELGGNDKAIVVIGREDGSGTRDGFESIVMQNYEPKYAQELESTGSVINAVSTTEGAIGYASLANVDDTITALKIDGVAPTEDTVKDGSFPVQRPFLCVVNEKNDNPLVDEYLEFVLSDIGQEQVKNAGVVPVN